ncbi:unnamed protein product [Caenorhabditis brenneri]
MSTFIPNITNDDDLIPFECNPDYSTPLEILKYIIQISYLIPGLYLNFILFITIWFKQWETYTILSYFVIYSTDCFGVMLVMNHSKTCKFIIQSLLVLNRMTCVMFPSTYAKSWRKWMKWLMALIFLTPLATDWNLVISRVYLQPQYGGFYFAYTRKVAWAKQSRFQLFFISIALFFTITCTSYTLHSLITLPNRIKNAERTISIASAYVSIGYLILGAFQFFYAFFPYIDGGYLFQFAHLAYDILNVGTPIIMICINKQFRQHAFGIKVPENPVAIPIFSMVQSRSG